MMIKTICWLAILTYASLAGECQTQTEQHLTIDGLDRYYLMVVPTGLEPGKKYPLVIILHGGGGQAKQVMDFCGFNPLAEKEKFLALYPNGYKKGWHDGRIAPKVDAFAQNIDDVKFISTVIDQAAERFPVDNTRIFVTGISNGAMMAIHLAENLSERIRAIAPVAGSIAENAFQDFRLTNPISVLVIHGTADPLVPYEGGPVMSERAGRGRVVGVMKMMGRWASIANETGNPVLVHLPDHDVDDDCTADRLTYSSSPAMRVELIRINEGGHTWPGGKQYLPKMIVGTVCRDFRAEEVIWGFFKNQAPR